jgi:hypothetical protein
MRAAALDRDDVALVQLVVDDASNRGNHSFSVLRDVPRSGTQRR